MEHPFIYDLATTRNPRSAFSYASFLLARNRLVEFANSDRLNPLRLEFEEYLEWCAEQFKDEVRYGHEVVRVEPERGEEPVGRWNVAVRDGNGKTITVQTKSIVAPSPSGRHSYSWKEKGKGRMKAQPLSSINFESGQRIISMADYLSRREEIRERRETPLNVAVVGSSQQAIEIVDDLLTCPRLGNITVVTENESLAPLRILGNEHEAPPRRLCSIWAKPSCEQSGSVTTSSELVQAIYGRAYEKQVASKGSYTLRIVIGSETAAPCATADIIITESESEAGREGEGNLFQAIDPLVLGCRQKGESVDEVHFKRGAVAEGCKMWMMSAHSEGGRSLAKDIAVRAGEMVSELEPAGASQERRGRHSMTISARM